LLVGLAFELGLLVALLFVGPLRSTFHMAPLPAEGWLLLAVWPLVLGAEELRRWEFRRWVWR
jgi:hypothetical protein